VPVFAEPFAGRWRSISEQCTAEWKFSFESMHCKFPYRAQRYRIITGDCIKMANRSMNKCKKKKSLLHNLKMLPIFLMLVPECEVDTGTVFYFDTDTNHGKFVNYFFPQYV
jgi:hypothetical protein